MYRILILLLILTYAVSSFAQPNISITEFSSGFSKPLSITHAGDDRLFVVEQAGRIWELDVSGNKAAEPFLDIRSKVNDGGNEQGLLGLAFPPDFDFHQEFYVYYTGGSGSGFSRVARYGMDSQTGKADPDSEETILQFNQPFTNHNGGHLAFGLDGYLYVGTGDGGSGGDPQNNAQNGQNFLGKILRLDVIGRQTYSIPSDNPFIDSTEILDEIFALGLRNPWRYSFDRLLGDLWIGDVGQNFKEEVNHIPAQDAGGQNFGWKCYEASSIFSGGGCPGIDFHFPIFEYLHNFNDGGYSITGGYVYRGSENEHFQGNYLFADYVTGRFWNISPLPGGEWLVQTPGKLRTDVSSFGENKDGELFVTDLEAGRIFKIMAECPDSTIDQPVIGPASEVDGLSVLDIDSNYMVQWYIDGRPWPGATDVEIPLIVSGDYSAEVSINVEGCIYRAISDEESVIIGIQDNVITDLELYPNPARDLLTVTLPAQTAQKVFVFDMNGRFLLGKDVRAFQGQTELNISGLSPGIYSILLQAEDGYHSGRFIKVD